MNGYLLSPRNVIHSNAANVVAYMGCASSAYFGSLATKLEAVQMFERPSLVLAAFSKDDEVSSIL